MDDKFRIDTDRKRGLISVDLSGFFEEADVRAFETARKAALDALGYAPNAHVTLVDVTACKIQSQPVVNAFTALVMDPSYKSRRLAFVTGSSLAKMQVRRLLEGRSNARCFDDRSSAEAWLTE